MDGLICFMPRCHQDLGGKKNTNNKRSPFMGFNIPAARNRIRQKEENVMSIAEIRLYSVMFA